MSKHPKIQKDSEKAAFFLLSRFGSVYTTLCIALIALLWVLWNLFAPSELTFDPGPSFVVMIVAANIIQLFIQPLMLISNNLQESANAKRAEDLTQDLQDIHRKLDALSGIHTFK